MKVMRLDHISLHVADVRDSVTFYKEVMGLEEIPRPPFSFQGAWLSLGNGQTLHLIGGRTMQPYWGSRGTHIAFAVVDISRAAAYFEERGVARTPVKERPDGIRQFFVADPDGYCLEICEVSV